MHFEQLIPGNYYHIYNRGVNKESIFREKDNYALFLSKYQKHCTSVFNTYAYNLLGNHFHLIIQVKPELSDQSADKKILNPSQQLGHFFNSYAQSINYKYKRTGSLFESPFHRKHIANDFYLSSAIFYTHNNALRHGFVRSITDWPHSSYHDLIAANKTFLSREAVLDWFGGREQFIQFHIRPNYIIESIWGEV